MILRRHFLASSIAGFFASLVPFRKAKAEEKARVEAPKPPIEIQRHELAAIVIPSEQDGWNQQYKGEMFLHLKDESGQWWRMRVGVDAQGLPLLTTERVVVLDDPPGPRLAS